MACALVGMSLYPGGAAKAASTTAAPVALTKTVTRDAIQNGASTTVDTRTITLSVAETAGLRGLQRVDVSWTGARPTGGQVADVNVGTTGVHLEYPMILLECRGVDSPTAPPAFQLTPSTCWTAYESSDRGLASPGPSAANETGFPPWRLDLYATADQRAAVVGAPDPAAVLAGTSPPTTAGAILSGCSRRPIEYWVPFIAADGSVYYPNIDCNQGPAGFPEPPEAAGAGQSLSFPSNETFAETAADGRGSTKFDVLTANENASLGCSDSVPCALVAIPVMGISCDPTAAGLPPEDQPSATQTVVGSSLTIAQKAAEDCTAQGNVPPGGNTSLAAPAVTGQFWWAASNWRNRITVPLSFAPVADPCSVLGSHREVDIYGSELMTEATAQWDPHFCSDPSLFTLKHIQTPEPEARNHLVQGLVSAVYASDAPEGTYTAPVVKAPVAMTGFAIAFSIDDNAGNPVSTLRLNARLLAKLLTESYPSNPDVVKPGDPGLANNPLNITQDPEFIALNPEIGAATGTENARQRAVVGVPSAATLFALSSDSDVMLALTSYIISDPEALAWLIGTPDPWGMVVNPHYNLSNPNTQISLPTDAWQLEDTFNLPATSAQVSGCPALGSSPYLGLVAAPVTNLFKIAQAMEFTQPFSTDVCKQFADPNTNLPILVPAREGPEAPGGRFMLGLISLGEASRYNLQMASLQSQVALGPAGHFPPVASRSFVAPTSAALRAAAGFVAPDPDTGTWQIPAGAIEASPSGAGAYPGAMVVSAQVPTAGLASTDAANLSKFLQFAAGPGQTAGSGYGQLPPGYLPMTAANGMGALAAYTEAAAAAVAAQAGTVPPLFPGDVQGGGTNQGGGQSASGGSGSSGSRSPSAGGVGASGTSSAETPSATGTAGNAGSSGGAGSSLSIGPTLRSITGPSNVAVLPPTAAPTTLLGKTVRIISGFVDSLLRWLVYLALLCAAAAGALYAMSGRGRFERQNLVANVVSWLAGLLSRRRLS